MPALDTSADFDRRAILGALGAMAAAAVPAAVGAISPAQRWIGSGSERLWTSSIGVGELVVAVAGGPGESHAVFRPELDRLADVGRLVFLDMPGCGASPPPLAGVSIAGQVAAIEVVRIAYGVSRLSLVCHSFAGGIGYAYAHAHPERLRAMALICPVVDQSSQEAAVAAAQKAATALAAASPGSEPGSIEARLYFADPANAPRLTPRTSGRDAPQADVSRSMLADPARLGDARAVACPTLIVAGRQDRIVPPALIERVRARIAPTAPVVWMGRSGHWPWIEEPRAVADAIANFLSGLPGPHPSRGGEPANGRASWSPKSGAAQIASDQPEGENS